MVDFPPAMGYGVVGENEISFAGIFHLMEAMKE
jgi:hypothetical protein